MSEFQTEAEFAANINSIFRLNVNTPNPIELTLIEVKSHQRAANEQADMERFSAVFSGPTEVFLPQQTYLVSHEQMGQFEIFLVPIGKESDGFRYEAIYNYFRSAAQSESKEDAKASETSLT